MRTVCILMAVMAGAVWANTGKLGEITARPGIVMRTDTGAREGSDFQASGGVIAGTSTQWAAWKFAPGIRVRSMAVELVGRTATNAALSPGIGKALDCLVIPNPDYTITASNYLTAVATNWFESVNQYGITGITNSGQVTATNALGTNWEHWVLQYDASASTNQWTWWRNGVVAGRRTKTRNQATLWEADGLFQLGVLNCFTAGRPNVEFVYVKSWAGQPFTQLDVTKLFLEWKRREQGGW